MNRGKVIFEAFGDTETPAMRVELGANANPGADEGGAEALKIGDQVEAQVARAEGGTAPTLGRVVRKLQRDAVGVEFRRVDGSTFELVFVRKEVLKIEQRSNPYDGGCLAFCYSKRSGDGGKIELGQEEAARLRDALTEWLEGRHA